MALLGGQVIMDKYTIFYLLFLRKEIQEISMRGFLAQILHMACCLGGQGN